MIRRALRARTRGAAFRCTNQAGAYEANAATEETEQAEMPSRLRVWTRLFLPVEGV